MVDEPFVGGVSSTSVPGATECGCITCQDRRRAALPEADIRQLWGIDPHFRYACDLCGNKRCPRHTDHRLACTGSNAAGQPGSVFT